MKLRIKHSINSFERPLSSHYMVVKDLDILFIRFLSWIPLRSSTDLKLISGEKYMLNNRQVINIYKEAKGEEQ